MMQGTTQFNIDAETKDRLDRFKAMHKDAILRSRRKTRRYVTNDDVIRYVLDEVGA